MNFFFDRNVAERLAYMLDAYELNHTVVHQDDDGRFDKKTIDVVLIEALGADTPKPVLVTADEGMQRNTDERRALSNSALTVIFLKPGWHDLPFHTQAVKLLKIWPEIVQQVSRAREPTAFEVSPAANKVERICTTSDLRYGRTRRRGRRK